jgi:hypothetical protein
MQDGKQTARHIQFAERQSKQERSNLTGPNVSLLERLSNLIMDLKELIDAE